MVTTKLLLARLTKAYPPFAGAKHAILLYEDKLHVVLALGGGVALGSEGDFQHITLEDKDLDRTSDELFADIAALLAATTSGARHAECSYVPLVAEEVQALTPEEAQAVRPGFKPKE